MKTLTKTVITEIETVAVDIPGTDRFVLVYTRPVGDEPVVNMHVMERKKYDKAASPDDIKNYQFIPPHFVKNGSYKAVFMPVTKGQYDAVRDGNTRWGDVDKDKKLTFGQELDEEWVVVGWCFADYTLYNLDETYLNVPVVQTYMEEHYDLKAMIAGEADNPDVKFIPGQVFKDKIIYYVPGNGYTLAMSMRVSDEVYRNMWMAGGWWEREKYLRDNSILAKYLKPELDHHDDE